MPIYSNVARVCGDITCIRLGNAQIRHRGARVDALRIAYPEHHRFRSVGNLARNQLATRNTRKGRAHITSAPVIPGIRWQPLHPYWEIAVRPRLASPD